jgi:hypothetical protein
MNTAVVSYRIDAAEFLAKSARIAALPDGIRTSVLSKAFRAVSRASESKIVKQVAVDTTMRQKDVRDKLRTFYSDHDVTHVVTSPWIPLAKLGAARQTKTGVTVRGWGAHRGAFILSKLGGNVYARTSAKRFPIKKLYGPNPANHINTHPERFRKILEDEADRRLLPEVDRLLGLLLDRL